MIMGGRTAPPVPKMPPPIPPPAEIDRPEITQAEMEMVAPKKVGQATSTGKHRKYRVKVHHIPSIKVEDYQATHRVKLVTDNFNTHTSWEHLHTYT